MKEIRSFVKSASLTELEKAKQLIDTAIEKYTQQQEAKKEVLDLLKEKGLTLIVEWTGRGKRPKAFQGVDLTKHLA